MSAFQVRWREWCSHKKIILLSSLDIVHFSVNFGYQEDEKGVVGFSLTRCGKNANENGLILFQPTLKQGEANDIYAATHL